ncbi:MAG: hypothetical protein IZT55_06260 [Anaerolineae bacterium]|nr:hypothetical protein [Anaerolineae bacterium]
MSNYKSSKGNLPIRYDITSLYIFSLITAILTAATSGLGLAYSSTIYPTEDLFHTFVPNDIVNLIIGLPILVGSIWAAWRDKLIGILLWPGALFFLLYNYLVYLFSMPFNEIWLLYLTLVTINLYTLIALIACIDGPVVKKQLSGNVSERLAGGVLSGLGLLFMIQVISTSVSTIAAQVPISKSEVALHMADFIIAPAWIIGGVLLWRRSTFGYLTGLGLLFQGSMLFVALISFLVLQPILTDMPFVLIDILTIIIMGMVCFIPFAVYLRGVISYQESDPQ